MSYSDTVRSLSYQPASEEQGDRINALRNVCKDFALAIYTDTRASREQSLAITKLEETLMWAVKAVVLEK
mgnify:CR=1 FL=1